MSLAQLVVVVCIEAAQVALHHTCFLTSKRYERRDFEKSLSISTAALNVVCRECHGAMEGQGQGIQQGSGQKRRVLSRVFSRIFIKSV